MGFSSPRLTVDSLSVVLGGNEILKPRSLSFSMDSGEIVGLLGPNGSGKSTLIGALCGLLKKNCGTVKYCGTDIASLRTRELAKIFAHVSQSERFSAAYTVLESVVMGRYPHLDNFSSYDDGDYDKARDSMRRVSLQGFENRVVTELSGGESARVMIARALAQDTPVILLDEPTASLDPKHSQEIMRLMRELAEEGRIILAAIHDINLAMGAASRLLFLKNGEITADRKADEVDAKILEDIYDIPWEICLVGDAGRRMAIPA